VDIGQHHGAALGGGEAGKVGVEALGLGRCR
jgi:hypothetical protein